MLEFLREKAGSWVIKILLFLIATIFAVMGVDMAKAPRHRSVAVVNGNEITIDDFQTAYNSQLNRLRVQFGNQLSEEMLKMMKLKERTLENLETRMLMLQQAEKYGITVSDQELTEEISKIFRSPDGSFNIDLYRETLAKNGISPEQFENSQREQIILGRLQDIIESGVKVTDAELKEWHSYENAEVNLDYVFFDPASFTGIEINEKDLSGYFEKHRDKYRTPVQMKIKYVTFRFDDYKARVQISKEEVASFYDANKNDFRLEKQSPGSPEFETLEEADGKIRNRIISEKYKSLAYNDAEKVNDAIMKGDNLEHAAGSVEGLKVLSTGLFTRSEGLKNEFSDSQPVVDAAFALDGKGQISDPVETDGEIVILEVEQKIAPRDVSLDEAKEKVKADFLKFRQDAEAKAKAEAFLAEIVKGADFSIKAGEYKVKASETGAFKRNGILPGDLGYSPEINRAAFELNAKNPFPKNIIKVSDRYYVVKFKSRMSPEYKLEGKEKDEFRKKILKTKQDDFLNSWIAELRKNSTVEILQPEMFK